MKKLSLNIKEPCHENWEAMTQLEKGKFCGSCQKTVVDFTDMSDRQIAEFFKKQAGSVCGRFYQDQLQRPIHIPKKRIPWVKYFFHVTWPAFVLFLKGCGQKENTVGNTVVEKIRDMRCDVLQVATVGFVMPEITAIDTPKIIQPEIIDTKCTITTTGLVGVEPIQTVMGDTITMLVETPEVLKEEIKETKEMDTVNVIGFQSVPKVRLTSCDQIISGMVLVENKLTQTNKNQIKLSDLVEDFNVTVYPNPVTAGSQITISSSTDKVIHQLQLFSSSGAMIKTVQSNDFNYDYAKFAIPASITPGTYFLRIILQDEKIKTAKIIVTN